MVRTKRRFGADEVAVAVESFVTEDNRVVKRGGRLRGDDPLVRANPHLFLGDGATDAEIGQARAGMLSFYDEPPPEDPTAPKIAKPLTAASPNALVVTKDASFTLEDRSRVDVRAGDLVDGNEPWVAKARRLKRGAFRKPTRQEISA